MGTLGSETNQDNYSSYNSSCVLNFFDTKCVAASTVTIGLTLSNDTGGVTTASVKLNVSAD